MSIQYFEIAFIPEPSCLCCDQLSHGTFHHR